MSDRRLFRGDIGGRLVTVGCAGGLCSLALPYATFEPSASLVTPSSKSLLGFSWVYGKLFFLLLVIGLVSGYLIRTPRLRAVITGATGVFGVLVPLLVFQLETGQLGEDSIYRAGSGAYIAQLAGACIIGGALYWWVRPDHSFPYADRLNGSEQGDPK